MLSTNLLKLDLKIKEKSNPEKAKLLQRFFKTGKGEYGEGDIFLGIIVPEQRKIAKKFSNLNIDEIQKLLDSSVHEKRMIGLFILTDRYKKACKRALLEKDSENKFSDPFKNKIFEVLGEKRSFEKSLAETEKEKNEEIKKQIFEFYLRNAKKNNINNWDLVDLSAPNIVGNYLLNRDRKILYKLVKSDNLWEKRIAVLSTFTLIRFGEFKDALEISKILLRDKHDLIHKAVGWMLREIGKKDKKILCDFLEKHCCEMPRTMLRYSIEKFPEKERKKWLRGER